VTAAAGTALEQALTRIIPFDRIRAALPEIDVVDEIERGFVLYSAGSVEVPPVGELLFPEAAGEFHVKYGVIRGDDVFVVKLATGFFRNPEIGAPPFSGCMIVLSARTGEVLHILLEQGELTNHRTAAAGAVAARHLAPPRVKAIGICGAGVQARLQADYLRSVTECRSLLLWGRDPGKAAGAVADIKRMGYDATLASTPKELAENAQLIVTTTPASEPYLLAEWIRPGTHVTAVGSDTPEKNEIDPALLGRAELVVADSISQCALRGEIRAALAAGVLGEESVVELGAFITRKARRRSATDITVADLTGVAVQDIMIAKAVVARTG
jgi:ornithine cyclodeaminase